VSASTAAVAAVAAVAPPPTTDEFVWGSPKDESVVPIGHAGKGGGKALIDLYIYLYIYIYLIYTYIYVYIYLIYTCVHIRRPACALPAMHVCVCVRVCDTCICRLTRIY
jgi:hypothetical protein